MFIENTYNLSYGGQGSSFIDIYGLTRVSMIGDVYNGVGEIIQDIILNDVAELTYPGNFYNI